MSYKYITDNNLEQIQTYMHSEFLGIDFLREYINIRKQFILDKELFFSIELLDDFIKNNISENETFFCLKEIVDQIHQVKIESVLEQINKFQKRFEVKKRLFFSYSKEINNAENRYDDLNSYILLSGILLLTYLQMNKLTYLSTVLKINDTLISNYLLLNSDGKKILSAILNTELCIINEIYKSKGTGSNLYES